MIKNILITGGAGYIGSHITDILVKNKKKIYIIDNLSTGFRRLINKKAKFFKLDIKETQKIKKIITKNKIDSIIHLAASLSIGLGEKHPKQYYKNNVLGTKSLINACIKTTIKNFIFSSTAAVYKDGLRIVKENSQIKPMSVYGKTKIKAEKIIISNLKKNNINYAILRYFNVCGASLSGKIGLITKGDHLFKNLAMETIKNNPKIKIYGNDYNTPDKTAIRDYIHVSDLAEIHIKVLNKIDKINKSSILNCGYNKGISVLEAVNTFKKYNKKNFEISYLNRRAGDMEMIIANNEKLRRFIKWRPKFQNISKIVESCIKWERKLK
jgi:UDP-glucose 4-epimerase